MKLDLPGAVIIQGGKIIEKKEKGKGKKGKKGIADYGCFALLRCELHRVLGSKDFQKNWIDCRGKSRYLRLN